MDPGDSQGWRGTRSRRCGPLNAGPDAVGCEVCVVVVEMLIVDTAAKEARVRRVDAAPFDRLGAHDGPGWGQRHVLRDMT